MAVARVANSDGDSILLFPTKLKLKIPKRLSSPFGAELISTALSSVPRAHTFEISFQGSMNAWKPGAFRTPFSSYLTSGHAIPSRGGQSGCAESHVS